VTSELPARSASVPAFLERFQYPNVPVTDTSRCGVAPVPNAAFVERSSSM
jgi:hypothetical protein